MWSTLKKRSDFLAARNGARAHAAAFVLQLRKRTPNIAASPNASDGSPRAHSHDGACRFGFTVTKKVGNAVVRNRIKRRFRAACDAVCQERLPLETDCVRIARHDALDLPFERLVRS